MISDKELHKKIVDSLKSTITPDRSSLMRILDKLDKDVTSSGKLRYNDWVGIPNIRNNTFSNIISVWKSKRMILIPSLILLLFVGGFSLSSKIAKHDLTLEQLLEQDETIEDEGINYDDQKLLTSFDEQSLDDISTIQNEI